MTDEKPGDDPAKEEQDVASSREREPAEADDVQAHMKKLSLREEKSSSSTEKKARRRCGWPEPELRPRPTALIASPLPRARRVRRPAAGARRSRRRRPRSPPASPRAANCAVSARCSCELRAAVAGLEAPLDERARRRQAHHEQLDARQRGGQRGELRAIVEVAGEHQPLDARLAEDGPDQADVLDEQRVHREDRGRRRAHPREPVEVEQRVGLVARLQQLADLDRDGRLARADGARQQNGSGGGCRRHACTIARGNAGPLIGR